MCKRNRLMSWMLAALPPLWVGLAGLAQAAPSLRVQVDQKGDFILIGNTIGYECNNLVLPVVGNANCAGALNTNDSSPDIYWNDGNADNGIAIAQAQSTAVLNVPPGATVTHAYLYWGATLAAAGVDSNVVFDRPGGFSQNISALTSYPAGNNSYHSVADVTALVQANGSGAYRVAGIDMINIVDQNNPNSFGGWWMVVLYQDPNEPLRNLAIYEGMDPVANGQPKDVTLSGFVVPNAGFTGKLGVITFEGDAITIGDQLFFNGGAALSDGQNPADNFFNATRSYLGNPITVAGDLPQMPGTARSMSGMDIDVVDVTAKLMAGQTSANIQATSTGDVYFLGGWVTSISTFRPDFTTSTKAAVDLNGGALIPGDEIEYTLNIINTGNDASINTVLTDALPLELNYVPGSLQITQGANAGMKTDPSGDDQGEFTAANNTITVRLGTGATSMQGGSLAIGESTTIVFKATVAAGTLGAINNQGITSAAGALGAPTATTPTDGNGAANGASPTSVLVEQCDADVHCPAQTPYCNVAATPNVCVQCLNDAHCAGLQPNCNPATNTCICVSTGQEICDGDDNDCNGSIDNGFNIGPMCSVGIGACENVGSMVCDGPSAVKCSAVPDPPSAEICGNMIDEDCDGTLDNACSDPDSDGDGLSDMIEAQLGTDPTDADSDNDGVFDGQEPDPTGDVDGDGLVNMLDADSDGDGLLDGTEMGLDCQTPGTDPLVCVPDADQGATTTDPLSPDSDGGALSDGFEDINKNGAVDPTERDPSNPADDQAADSDADSIPDHIEAAIGTDPNDADIDDDGVLDGQEPSPLQDIDGDGLSNIADFDSDGDGLPDGLEMGFDCSHPDTDASMNTCLADADMGATQTNSNAKDSDQGGMEDGDEDVNRNGWVDPKERDPNNAFDDQPNAIPCAADGDCGAMGAGKACGPNRICLEGCRGTVEGNCPQGQVCTSADDTIGICMVPLKDGPFHGSETNDSSCTIKPIPKNSSVFEFWFLGILAALSSARLWSSKISRTAKS